MRYVEVFVRRNLKFDSDILDAFAGVINCFRVDFGLTCTYGILDSLFGLDIHWHPEEWVERREGFPSWSGLAGRARSACLGMVWTRHMDARPYVNAIPVEYRG